MSLKLKCPLGLIALIALSLCFGQLTAAPYVFTERSNWHISATGAMTFSTDSQYDINGSDGSNASGRALWENGPAVMVAGGYTYNQWRFELEYSFRQASPESANFGNLAGLGRQGGEISMHTIMLNAAYDWFLFERFFAYGGLGIGTSFVRLNHGGFDDTNAAIAGQVMAGFGYKLTEGTDIYMGYRMFRSTDSKFQNGVNGVSYNIEYDMPWMNHWESGVRFRF